MVGELHCCIFRRVSLGNAGCLGTQCGDQGSLELGLPSFRHPKTLALKTKATSTSLDLLLGGPGPATSTGWVGTSGPSYQDGAYSRTVNVPAQTPWPSLYTAGSPGPGGVGKGRARYVLPRQPYADSVCTH